MGAKVLEWSWFAAGVTGFYMNFHDQIEFDETSFENVGRSIHHGVETEAALALMSSWTLDPILALDVSGCMETLALVITLLFAPTSVVSYPGLSRPDCPSDFVCEYEQLLRFERENQFAVRFTLLRPLEVRVLGLWRLEGGRWRVEPFQPRVVTIAPHEPLGLDRLVGRALPHATWFAAMSVNDRLECHDFAVIPPGTWCCGSSIRGPIAPEMIRACVASDEGVKLQDVPDPKLLVQGCDTAGYLARRRPASGDGVLTELLEDGRVAAETPLQGGLRHGTRVERLSQAGAALHLETPYRQGRRHGLQRQFFDDGRVFVERPWVDDKVAGVERQLSPTGDRVEERTIRDGRVMRARVLSGGRVLAEEVYGPDGYPGGARREIRVPADAE